MAKTQHAGNTVDCPPRNLPSLPRGIQKHKETTDAGEPTQPSARNSLSWSSGPNGDPRFDALVQTAIEATLNHVRSWAAANKHEQGSFDWVLKGDPHDPLKLLSPRVDVRNGDWHFNVLIFRGKEKLPAIISCIEGRNGCWTLAAVITEKLACSNVYLYEQLESTYPVPALPEFKPLYWDLVKKQG